MASVLGALKRFFEDRRFSARLEFLRGLPLCEGLRRHELGSLQQSFHSRVYKEGEALFLEGDIGRALFIVETGKVELTKRGADGSPQRITELGPGALFGEMALLEQLPRSASAVAMEKSEMLLLYRSKLDEILHYHPRIGVAVMRHLARLLSARLRRVSDQVTTVGATFAR